MFDAFVSWLPAVVKQQQIRLQPSQQHPRLGCCQDITLKMFTRDSRERHHVFARKKCAVLGVRKIAWLGRFQYEQRAQKKVASAPEMGLYAPAV